MTATEHVRTLDRIYTAALRHHAFTQAQFVAGVYDSAHTQEMAGELNKRVAWLVTLCEVARRHFNSILSGDDLRPSVIEPAQRATLAVHALANAALHYFRAYALPMPNAQYVYRDTFAGIEHRINNY